MCFRPPTAQKRENKCPECGTVNEPTATECVKCGAKLTQQGPPPPGQSGGVKMPPPPGQSPGAPKPPKAPPAPPKAPPAPPKAPPKK